MIVAVVQHQGRLGLTKTDKLTKYLYVVNAPFQLKTMDAIRKELLETIAKSRSRTKANPFRENVVRFATTAEPATSSPRDDQSDYRNNSNAGAVEAESIQLRSGAQTFRTFLAIKKDVLLKLGQPSTACGSWC